MKPEQLKPIIQNLNSQLLNILVKLDPKVKSYYSAKNPSFIGIGFLIKQGAQFFGKAGESELKQLLDLTIRVRNYFKLHTKDKTFATCFVLVPVVNLGIYNINFRHDFNTYFFKSYMQTLRNVSHIDYDLLISIMLDQEIDGLTLNTYLKFFAKKGTKGNIEILHKSFLNQNESDIFPKILSELSEQIPKLFTDDIKIARNTIVDSFKKEWDLETLTNTELKIREDFYQYAKNVYREYESLMETFDILVDTLNGEIKSRQDEQGSYYLRLQYDETTNNKIKQFLYNELNGKYFHTSQSNFFSVFSDENTIPIKWEAGLNAFLKLFLGYENLNIDGISHSFDGLILKRKDVFYSIENCFTFEYKSQKPLPHYISSKIKTIEPKTPREMPVLFPIIQKLKKEWCKQIN